MMRRNLVLGPLSTALVNIKKRKDHASNNDQADFDSQAVPPVSSKSMVPKKDIA